MSGGGDCGVLLASRLSVGLGVIFVARMSGVDGQAYGGNRKWGVGSRRRHWVLLFCRFESSRWVLLLGRVERWWIGVFSEQIGEFVDCALIVQSGEVVDWCIDCPDRRGP